MPRRRFDAADDDPVALANRALKEVRKAIEEDDDVGIREAAEKGWLAVSAVADVAAAELNLKKPEGRNARQAVLLKLADCAGVRPTVFRPTFTAARDVLHGRCFHDNNFDEAEVVGLLEDVQDMTEQAMAALRRCKRRR